MAIGSTLRLKTYFTSVNFLPNSFSFFQYLCPWQWLDVREFVLFSFRVHLEDLILSWSSQNFDNFNELVDS
mgnify:CR=1 FL=1